MNEAPDKLQALLKQWHGVAPRPAFEQDVLRRIRLDREQGDSAATGVWGWLAGWTGAAKAAAGLALVAAVIGGAGLAFMQENNGDSILDRNAFTLLRPGSVAGNYVAMSGDVSR